MEMAEKQGKQVETDFALMWSLESMVQVEYLILKVYSGPEGGIGWCMKASS